MYIEFFLPYWKNFEKLFFDLLLAVCYPLTDMKSICQSAVLVIIIIIFSFFSEQSEENMYIYKFQSIVIVLTCIQGFNISGTQTLISKK